MNTLIKTCKPVRTAVSSISAFAGLTLANNATAQGDAYPLGDVLELQSIVVTGTGGGVERRKIDTSYAITTANFAQLDDYAPRGFADSLKLVPGIAVESSGGESSNNAFVRGLVSSTLGFPYMAFLEDGLPIVNQFNDWPFRFSSSVHRIEGVRGGTAPVTEDQAIGGLINYVNRDGGATPEGEIVVQFGDYNHKRVDAFVSGPLDEDTYYFLGGYFREDNGIRDVGYAGSSGGQIQGSIKRLIGDNGFVKFSAKFVDDTPLFYVPMPIQDRDNPQSINGLAIDETLLGIDLRDFTGPGIKGTQETAQLGNEGQFSEYFYAGFEFQTDFLDKWTLNNKFRYTKGDVGLQAMFNRSDDEILTAQQAVEYVRGTAMGFGGEFSTRFLETNAPNALFLLSRDHPFWVTNASALTVDQASNLNGNGLFAVSNFDQILGEIENVQNQLSVNRAFNLGENKTWNLQLGHYYSDKTQAENFRRDLVLHDIKNHAERYDIVFGTGEDILDDSGAQTANSAGFGTLNGIVRTEDFASAFEDQREQTGTWMLNTITMDKWTFDVGARRQTMKGEWRQLGSWMTDNANFSGGVAPIWSEWDTADQPNPVLSSIPIPPQGFRTRATLDKRSDTSYTFGANFLASEDQSFWGRVTKGVELETVRGTVGDGIVGSPFRAEMDSIELGWKYNARNFASFITLFSTDMQNVAIGDTAVIDGQLAPIGVLTGSNTIGLEIEAAWNPVENLNLRFVGTIQNPELENVRDRNSLAPIVTDDSLEGNRPTRQPESFFTLHYDYTFREVPGVKNVKLFGNTQIMGDRFANIGNTFKLDSYSLTSLGVAVIFSDNLKLELQASNVFDSDGLTEGNPRGGQQVGVSSSPYFWARPVLPRSVISKLTYRF